MRLSLNPLLCGAILAAAASAPAQTASSFDAAALNTARTMLGDIREVVSDEYRPAAKVTPAFLARCAETDRALGSAKSMNEAYALIADTLSSLDKRIRLHPPGRTTRVDYSWEWRLIGPAAYVTQVDREGDAAKQGLRLGDKILSFEGLPLDRENYQQINYAMNTLAPRPGLRVQVQSPGQEPRWLAIASTIRPQRKTRTVGAGTMMRFERVYTKEEHRRFDEFRDPKNHVRRVGQVAVWRANELRQDSSAVADGLKLVRGASGLVLDLRGQYVRSHKTVLRLLDGLFTESFESGAVEKEGLDDKLRVNGGSQSFTGTVLVLVDSETASYAEVLARILQQKQRGVIIGDHTMGRVLQELSVGFARGTLFSFTSGGMYLPSGEIVMADGVALDGRGVAPDYRLLPAPADLAGRRDIVLSKALAMLKETLSPEDAYKLFPHYGDIDDDYDFEL
jgi:C-terminal processing protease CtpA/Prc